MHRINLLPVVIVLLFTGCDVPTGYEYDLINKNKWPQKVTGTFSYVDSGSYDGDYAMWAIGILELPNSEESILIEFKGNVLKVAGIDHEFGVPDPLTVEVEAPIDRYFQVKRVILE